MNKNTIIYKKSTHNKRNFRHKKTFKKVGGGSNIEEDDLYYFVNFISNYDMYRGNFDYYCRTDPVLLKFFRKPSDCDILFLKLMSKRRIIFDLLKSVKDKSYSVKIDQLSDYITNNTCIIKKDENVKNKKSVKVDDDVVKIVDDVFSKFFSFEQMKNLFKPSQISIKDKRITKEQGTPIEENIQELQDELLKEYMKNKNLFEDVIKKTLSIYFGENNKEITVEECQIVHSIFNLSRLNSLLIIDEINQGSNKIRFLESMSKELKEEFKKIINARLMMILDTFLSKYLKTPIYGGGFLSKLKKFGKGILFPFVGTITVSLFLLCFSSFMVNIAFSPFRILNNSSNISYSRPIFKVLAENLGKLGINVFKKWWNIKINNNQHTNLNNFGLNVNYNLSAPQYNTNFKKINGQYVNLLNQLIDNNGNLIRDANGNPITIIPNTLNSTPANTRSTSYI